MKIIKSKVFKILIILFLIGMVFGIISFFIIDETDKLSITNTLTSYINNIKNDDFDYGRGLINSIIYILNYLL